MFYRQLKKSFQDCHRQLQDSQSQLAAIGRAMAVIEFDLQGNVLAANTSFLSALGGYQLADVLGKHHSLFVDQSYANSSDYRQFWQRLNAGEFFSDRFKRIGKGGKVVWIEASYNPILGEDGRPYKVVKFATDITERVIAENDAKGQLAAINRAMAVIEFDLTGNILRANENFLQALGYQAIEVAGKHHRVFVEDNYANSADYRQFWQRLGSGEFVSDTFKRIGKGGKVVWIEASYNPIFDADGKPYKVVKYATDVTKNELAKQSLACAMNAATETLSVMSQGDLTQRIEGKFEGRLADLQKAVNDMAARLQEVVGAAIAASHVVNDAATQVSQGSHDLSGRVQEQASSLEETSATMHEMTSAVQANTANARKVADLTLDVQHQANAGKQVMEQTIGAMQSIRESSTKIADIVTLIDSIAFQTNLLALNAAVEAARAGEHGRGFAVVASEVRALAGKSADAAKDIKTLINDSVNRIQAGTQLADQSGVMLSGIADAVAQVATMIEQIAGASNEQSVGIGQVNIAINAIDSVTQENAALVEETSSAAESLRQEANGLLQNMSFFQIGQVSLPITPKTVSIASMKQIAQQSSGLPGCGDEWREF